VIFFGPNHFKLYVGNHLKINLCMWKQLYYLPMKEEHLWQTEMAVWHYRFLGLQPKHRTWVLPFDFSFWNKRLLPTIEPTIQWMFVRKESGRSTMYIYGIFWFHTFANEEKIWHLKQHGIVRLVIHFHKHHKKRKLWIIAELRGPEK
jgi:hypothetical protein